MNGLFLILIVVCGVMFSVKSPDMFFSALVYGGERAALLSAKLISIYAISMGIIKIARDAGLLDKLSKLLLPLNKRLFKCDDEEVCGFISANMSANLLGMGSVATPMGISAMDALLKRKNNSYPTAVFFVVNTAGLQLLPLTVVALRSSSGSSSPSDIILPSVLSMAVCLICSLILVNIFVRKD